MTTTLRQTKKQEKTTMRTLNSLLIVYLGPPLMAAALLLFMVSWLGDKPFDAQVRTRRSAVRKGGRIGSQSEMFR